MAKYDDLLERIDTAVKRIADGGGLMRIPVDKTDPDEVLADCAEAIKELRVDAERFDWLELMLCCVECHYDEDLKRSQWWTEDYAEFRLERDTLREAVDAARERDLVEARRKLAAATPT